MHTLKSCHFAKCTAAEVSKYGCHTDSSMFDSLYGNKNDAIIFSIVENLCLHDLGICRLLKLDFLAEKLV